MKRRQFLKGMLALPIMAALPIGMLSSETVMKDSIHVKFDNAENRFKFQYQDGGYIVSKGTSQEITNAVWKNSPFVRLSNR